MRYLLVLLGLLVSGTAQAIDCKTPPTCASLGYATTDDPNCEADGYVYCPFDHTYKKCVQHNCAKLGFTQTDKTSWCADIIKCKTNENLTLCKTPCLAWDQDTLKSLAGSGKCKVVTVKNDITVDAKTLINVAQGTTIEGNGHTLTMLKETGDVIQLRSMSVLRNITVQRDTINEADTQLITINAAGIILEDVTLIDKTSLKQSNHEIIYAPSNSFIVRGKSRFEALVGSIYNGVGVYENATIEAESQHSVFVNSRESVAKNSVINATAKSIMFNGFGNFTFINSTFKGKSSSLIYSAKGYTVTLEEGSHFEAEINSIGSTTFVLNGTEDKPVTLVLNLTSTSAKVDVRNLNATVTLKGITYKPKTTGTFTTTAITTSTDWEKVS